MLFQGCIVLNNPENSDRSEIKILEPHKNIILDLEIPYNNFCGIVLLYKPIDLETNLNIRITSSGDSITILNKSLLLKNFNDKYKTTKILFAPIKDSANKKYNLYLASDKNIKIFGNKREIYHSAIYKINFKYILKNFIEKFYSDKIFFYLYLVIAAGLILLIIFL